MCYRALSGHYRPEGGVINSPKIVRDSFDPKHIVWLERANAANYSDKRYVFYPFKTRLLRRFAIPDGYDKQVLALSCFNCNGTGRYAGHACDRCTKGVYDIKSIYLIRWSLCGRMFHEPAHLINGLRYVGDYKELIRGYIRHPDPGIAVGRRSMERLLLRYEPATYYVLWINRWRDWVSWRGVRLKYNVERVKSLLRKSCLDDDVPF